MFPFGPIQLMCRGPVLYAELWIGLCRALAAPWLSPWQRGQAVTSDAAPPARDATSGTAPPAAPQRASPPRLRVVSGSP